MQATLICKNIPFLFRWPSIWWSIQAFKGRYWNKFLILFKISHLVDNIMNLKANWKIFHRIKKRTKERGEEFLQCNSSNADLCHFKPDLHVSFPFSLTVTMILQSRRYEWLQVACHWQCPLAFLTWHANHLLLQLEAS